MSIVVVALRTIGSDYRLRLTTKVLSTIGEGAPIYTYVLLLVRVVLAT
jgi:hypothetical protein